MKGYYTSADAAKILGLAVRSVRVYVWRHKLGQKIMRDILLDEKDLDFLRNRRKLSGRPRGEKRKDYDPADRHERYELIKGQKN